MPTRLLLHVRPEFAVRLGIHADLMRQFDEYLKRQMALNVFAHSTTMACHCDARRFLIYYAKVPLERLTPEHIERYLESRSATLGPQALHTEFMRLRVLFRWLRDDQRLLKQNPCDRVHKPRFHPTPRPAPSKDEFKRMCRACRTVEEALIVEVLYHTGLRIRELCTLKEQQVNVADRSITVRGKGGRTYAIPFPPHVGDLLGAWLIGAPDAWVFHSSKPWGEKARARRPEWVGIILHRLGREIGLPYKLTAHLLRHGLARALKTSEMPMAVIQQIMRHQNITTTINMYGRLPSDDLRRAYDKYVTGRD